MLVLKTIKTQKKNFEIYCKLWEKVSELNITFLSLEQFHPNQLWRSKEFVWFHDLGWGFCALVIKDLSERVSPWRLAVPRWPSTSSQVLNYDIGAFSRRITTVALFPFWFPVMHIESVVFQHLGSTHNSQQTLKTLYSAKLNIQALTLQIAQTSIWDCQEPQKTPYLCGYG